MKTSWQQTTLPLAFGGLFALSSGLARAAEVADDIDDALIITGDTYFYTGNIGENLPIQLSLTVVSESSSGKPFSAESGQPIRGFYFYESIGTQIILRGTLRRGQLELTECNCGKTTGRFKGPFDPGNSRQTLKWHSPDGKRALDAQLTLVARSTRVQREEGSIWISHDWPTLLGQDSLSRALDAFVQQDARTSVDAALKDARQCAEEERESDFRATNWNDQTQLSLLYFNPSLISLQSFHLSYTGGAHSNYQSGGRCFVLRKGKPKELRLPDLFRPGSNYMQRLCELCEVELKRRGASSLTLNDARRLHPDDITEFQINPGGLTIIFNPYVVGCYAEGGYFVEIPWRKICGLLGEMPEIRRLAGQSEGIMRSAHKSRK